MAENDVTLHLQSGNPYHELIMEHFIRKDKRIKELEAQVQELHEIGKAALGLLGEAEGLLKPETPEVLHARSQYIRDKSSSLWERFLKQSQPADAALKRR